jgi:uncharacterized protein YjbI with pentapeptide repeats
MIFGPGSPDEYFDRKFSKLVYEDQILEFIEFHDCVFRQCSFQATEFSGCKFSDCKFIDCNLSLVKFDGCTFAGVRFEGSQLVGINWARANLSGKSLKKPFDIQDCNLNYSVFMGANLKDVKITGCSAREVDFSEAILKQVDASGSDFIGSRFVNTDLTEADFSRAMNYQINATQNKLKGTKFSLPEAMSLLRSLDIQLVE